MHRFFFVNDQDINTSKEKGKQKANVGEIQNIDNSFDKLIQDRREVLTEQLGEESYELIESIIQEEFGDMSQEGTISYMETGIVTDFYEDDDEIAQRRKRYDSFSKGEKLLLDKAKVEADSIMNNSGNEEEARKKLNDKSNEISQENYDSLDDYSPEAVEKRKFLGDLFEVYKYGPNKFDRDRGLNVGEKNKQPKNDDDDPENPQGPSIGGNDTGSNEGAGPSNSSSNRSVENFKEKCIFYFATLGCGLDSFLEVFNIINL